MSELKPGWKRVKFGDVVRLNGDRCVNPLEQGIDRYVGLEHLEPGNLRVCSWGNVADGTTFTNRFKPGQVLFGKRRAYQKKVALADFDGVCSSDIYVFESADPKKLLPELLPFLCQTDAFFEYAIGTSAGSLSPRTNWTSLSEYEFALPPVEEQRRLAKALNASAIVVEQSAQVLAAAEPMLAATLLDSFAKPNCVRSLGELCRNPITYGIVQAGPDMPGGVPYVRVSEMTNRDVLDPATMMCTTPEINSAYSRTILESNDIVVALRGVPGLSLQIPESLVGGNLSRGVARVAVNSENNSGYVLWALRSPQGRRAVLKVANGWKGEDLRELTIAGLRSIPIPWVEKTWQDKIAEKLGIIHGGVRSMRERNAGTRAQHLRICNWLFSGVI